MPVKEHDLNHNCKLLGLNDVVTDMDITSKEITSIISNSLANVTINRKTRPMPDE